MTMSERVAHYQAGDEVMHETFGLGKVLDVSPHIVTVSFRNGRELRLKAPDAPMRRLDDEAEETVQESQDEAPQLQVQELCFCGRPLRHRGHHRGTKVTKTQSITVKRTESHGVSTDSKRIERLESRIRELEAENGELKPKPQDHPWDFWLDAKESEIMARDMLDPSETVRLFGALVPVHILDVIWYSFSSESKARLLSALDVARWRLVPIEGDKK